MYIFRNSHCRYTKVQLETVLMTLVYEKKFPLTSDHKNEGNVSLIEFEYRKTNESVGIISWVTSDQGGERKNKSLKEKKTMEWIRD